QSYMTKHNYPDYLSHKSEHDKFIEDFLGLKKEFQNGASISYLKIQLRMKLNFWLINHIAKYR
ncbi:MAG: hemerythrin, partial [Nitrospirota bacterium]